jgi:CBS domain-containing protein
MQMEVKDIVKDAVVINEETTFREALSAMLNGKTNTLLVVDEDGKLSGEITVADLLDAIVPDYLDGDTIAANFATPEMFEEAVKNAESQEVRFFMSQDYNAVELDDGLMTVATTAIAHQRARIPVVDKEDRPVGIISRQGLKHILAEFLGIEDTA